MSIDKSDSRENRAILQYSNDIENMGGYIYTGNNARKSMDIFNRRASMSLSNLISWAGASVIDIGCGDGTFTAELVTGLGAARAVGIEPSDAWKLGQSKHKALMPVVEILQGSAYKLDFPDKAFDIAIMRGVVHHLDDPVAGLKEMSRVARHVVLLEPNGYNPIIKMLEIVSPYHRAHGEKSYPPAKIRRWLTSLGGQFQKESFTSLVPLLCPDKVAEFLDKLSQPWERLPLIPVISCGLYCVHFSFDRHPGAMAEK